MLTPPISNNSLLVTLTPSFIFQEPVFILEEPKCPKTFVRINGVCISADGVTETVGMFIASFLAFNLKHCPKNGGHTSDAADGARWFYGKTKLIWAVPFVSNAHVVFLDFLHSIINKCSLDD